MNTPQPGTLAWLDLQHSVPAVLLWAVVLGRAGMLRDGPAARSLWLALLALAGGATVHISPLRSLLLQAGGPGGLAVATQTFTLAASAFVLLLLAQTTAIQQRSPGATRRLATTTVIALVLMALPLLVTRPAQLTGDLANQPESLPTLDAAAWAVHWTAVLGYLGWALLAAVLLCRRYGHEAPAGPLRTRLQLIGLGCGSGLLLVAVKVAVVVASFVDVGEQWNTAGRTVQGALLMAALLLIAVGSGYPQLVAAAAAMTAEATATRSLLRLRRLWRLMYATVPHIALAPSPLTSVLAGPLRMRERLYRRVMEIRDGLLALSPYAGAHLRADVAASAVARGSSTAESEVVAEAVWITAAVRAKQAGESPSDDAASIGASQRGGADLSAEVAWLELVAEAHARWPLTRQMEAEHLPERVGRAA